MDKKDAKTNKAPDAESETKGQESVSVAPTQAEIDAKVQAGIDAAMAERDKQEAKASAERDAALLRAAQDQEEEINRRVNQKFLDDQAAAKEAAMKAEKDKPGMVVVQCTAANVHTSRGKIEGADACSEAPRHRRRRTQLYRTTNDSFAARRSRISCGKKES